MGDLCGYLIEKKIPTTDVLKDQIKKEVDKEIKFKQENEHIINIYDLNEFKTNGATIRFAL